MADVRDHHYMARALVLGRRGLYTTDPNPRVGCVLVKDDTIVGEGWHVRTGEAHAEVIALDIAGAKARGATAYITLEPCCHYGRTPPCTEAMLAAGIARTVIAMEDPNPKVAGKGMSQLRAAGVAVECGIMEAEARALNPGYISRIGRGRPYVRCKLAMSLDGRTAMASGESRWITSAAARQDVHQWRGRASAIMTGVATVLADDPSLNVRLSDTLTRQPLRVILDPELVTPPTARTLCLEGDVLVFTGVANPQRQHALQATGAQVKVLPQRDKNLDLKAVLQELAYREINEVHLESGATLAGAMLQAGLIDEFILYMAPWLLGDMARGLFHLPYLDRMADRIALEIVDIRAVGQDWRIQARPR
jgi:diaminohydroxyphosphoribosylaminopyrimidine deaminase/5-amino-6-(5-phosphoribosylamino)uracil reductase